jgi:hypothetical protein
MPEHPAQPPARHPYLIMNPKSGGGKIEVPQALLVSNNPYGTGDIAGLLRGRHVSGLSVLTTKQIETSADVPRIPVGVEGESIVMPTPVTRTVSPGALRVWVPRDRPGVRCQSRRGTGPGCGTLPAFRKPAPRSAH